MKNNNRIKNVRPPKINVRPTSLSRPHPPYLTLHGERCN